MASTGVEDRPGGKRGDNPVIPGAINPSSRLSTLARYRMAYQAYDGLKIEAADLAKYSEIHWTNLAGVVPNILQCERVIAGFAPRVDINQEEAGSIQDPMVLRKVGTLGMTLALQRAQRIQESYPGSKIKADTERVLDYTAIATGLIVSKQSRAFGIEAVIGHICVLNGARNRKSGARGLESVEQQAIEEYDQAV